MASSLTRDGIIAAPCGRITDATTHSIPVRKPRATCPTPGQSTYHRRHNALHPPHDAFIAPPDGRIT